MRHLDGGRLEQHMSRDVDGSIEIILNGLEAIYLYMREQGFPAEEIKETMEKYHAIIVDGFDTHNRRVN